MVVLSAYVADKPNIQHSRLSHLQPLMADTPSVECNVWYNPGLCGLRLANHALVVTVGDVRLEEPLLVSVPSVLTEIAYSPIHRSYSHSSTLTPPGSLSSAFGNFQLLHLIRKVCLALSIDIDHLV